MIPTRTFLLRSFSAALAEADKFSIFPKTCLVSSDPETSSGMLILEVDKVVCEDPCFSSSSSFQSIQYNID